jgi:murein DD-endopeptidase MepM/ murein hydrolase activator NlpD
MRYADGFGCVLFFVVAAAVGVACAEAPTILSPYRDMKDPGGNARAGPHPAVDFGGKIGDPVLAAANGRVTWARQNSGPCGNGIRIRHGRFERYTLYCQLSRIDVQVGDRVKRGQVIGALGVSGEPLSRAGRYRIPIPMLHFELASTPHPRGDGELRATFDPLLFIVGCFDPAKEYPADRFALTYPLKCN